MEKIIHFLKETYAPLSIIVYGSYANGTNNLNSDFDALVITHEGVKKHITDIIDGVKLDVFVYPAELFKDTDVCQEFIQIFDGNIVLDTDDIGLNLKNNVTEYIKKTTNKPREEIHDEIIWCKKMLERTKRNDVEGAYRYHWLLVDSLQIFFSIINQYYFGPKKSLNFLQEEYPTAYELYSNALTTPLSYETLEPWITYMEDYFTNQ